MIVALRNTICILGLILISPILFISAIFIIIEDGYPPFFIQDRLGKNEEIFSMYKIRTMKKKAPQDGTHNVNEKYHLTTGKLIRKLKLDEFPQIVNVIRGDINLIGPRPGLIMQQALRAERSKKNIYSVKPGITGLAQSTGFDMADPEKLAKVDEIYIKKKSPKLMILIFMATFFKLPREILKRQHNLYKI
jgi:O-antigen biosynthesis protein WbqP